MLTNRVYAIYVDAMRAEILLSAKSLVGILSSRAALTPSRVALTFLNFGPDSAESLTYRELHERALGIACRLKQRGLALGDRAVVAHSPSLEYVAAFFGCLYAGVVAVPAYPPDLHPARLNKTLPRLLSVVRDSAPKVVLASKAVTTTTAALAQLAPELAALSWLATDEIAASSSPETPESLIDGSTLAFLQYTSGSTSTPKGVMLSHDNLLRNCAIIRENFGLDERSVAVIWLPPYHDMGLIGGILQPIATGHLTVLMSPASFLAAPLRWLRAVTQYGGTVSGGPNFAFDLCVRKVRDKDMASLDLSSWTLAFNGAEPVNAETLERFTRVFSACGFRPEAMHPVYGLAEATLLAAGGDRGAVPNVRGYTRIGREVEAVSDGDSIRRVSCGAPLFQETLIVDPENGTRLHDAAVGEVWLRDPSVAVGYWGREEETRLTFNAKLSDDDQHSYLRTGDLGFLDQGELFLVSRLKDIIIVNGVNYYPADIESALAGVHPNLRAGCGAAFSIEVEGGERLCVAWEVQAAVAGAVRARGAIVDELVGSVRAAVISSCELYVHTVALVAPGVTPKTSSGKIQRRAFRDMVLSGGGSVLFIEAPRAVTDSQRRLGESDQADVEVRSSEHLLDAIRQRLSVMLGLPLREVTQQASPPRLGLDSIGAVTLAAELEGAFHIEVTSLDFLVDRPIEQTLRELLGRSSPSAKEQAEAVARCALSVGQRAMWFLHRLSPGQATYNLALRFRLTGDLDLSSVRAAVSRVLRRHAILGVRFREEDGMPYQEIGDATESLVTICDASTWDESTLEHEMLHVSNEPFDLRCDAPVRVRMFDGGAHGVHLALCAHHIVCDLRSLLVVWREIGEALQRGNANENASEEKAWPRRDAYFDFVTWQRDLPASTRGRELEEFWRKRLSSPCERPKLPRTSSASSPSGASSVRFKIDAHVTQRLRKIAGARGVTLFTVLLSAFQILLSRFASQRAFRMLTSVHGRTNSRFAESVGYFVNQLVIDADVDPARQLGDFLGATAKDVLEVLAHQDYPFATAVQNHGSRDGTLHPFSNVMFLVDRVPAASVGLANAVLREPGPHATRLGSWPVDVQGDVVHRNVEFDLLMWLLDGHEVDGDLPLSGAIEFSTALFSAASIERLSRHFTTILREIAADPTRSISSIWTTPDEQLAQIAAWNATSRTFPGMADPLHVHVEAQVNRSPEAVAVVSDGLLISYRDLDRRANQIANRLRAVGVRRNDIVAVQVERSPLLVATLLGILKAGAAYLPVETDWPQERVKQILGAARPRCFVSAMLQDSGALTKIVRPTDADSESDLRPNAQGDGNDLAYVLYTSGSTGQPKGVMIQHAGIGNRLLWMQAEYGLTPADRVLQKTPVTFDVSVWEFFWPLMVGATIVLAAPGGHRDPQHLRRQIVENSVTTVHFVPSMLEVFVASGCLAECSSLRRVFSSGETLTAELASRFFEQSAADLHNLYGPTEASIDVSYWKCERGVNVGSIPIGRPIANTQLYVVDSVMRQVPIGAEGDLTIGGIGLAAGYLGDAKLTGSAFVPDPFEPAGSGRLYRTGDRARFLDDGAIAFLGRSDQQVKIRGIRVELEEIEARISECAGVVSNVVALQDDVLVAFVTSTVGAEAEQLFLDSVREHVATCLPQAMVPSHLFALAELPHTPSGKVDRKALPEWRHQFRPTIGARVFSDEEAEIAGVWRELLGLPSVQVGQDFFAVGGHSLLLVRLAARLSELFLVEVSLARLFESRTIEQMALLVADLLLEQTDPVALADTLADTERRNTES